MANLGYHPELVDLFVKKGNELVQNTRIENAIDKMKNGSPKLREKASKEYDKLAQERANLARQKFYERHSTGHIKDL